MKTKIRSKDTSPTVSQRDKVAFELKIKEFPWSEKQQQLIQLIEDKKTKVVFLHGPAGSAKTHISVYTALRALNIKRMSEIVYIRQPVESSKYNIGFLKGGVLEKLAPYAQPLEDKLSEFLNKREIEQLKTDERISCVPVGFMRGRSFNTSYIIVDEAQNLTMEDLLLVMTRLGKFSKMIITGDIMQPDIKSTAFQKVSCLFDDEESEAKGIHVFKFGKEDIFRNEILSFIIEKFENIM